MTWRNVIIILLLSPATTHCEYKRWWEILKASFSVWRFNALYATTNLIIVFKFFFLNWMAVLSLMYTIKMLIHGHLKVKYKTKHFLNAVAPAIILSNISLCTHHHKACCRKKRCWQCSGYCDLQAWFNFGQQMQLMQDGSSGQFSERAAVVPESGLCLSGCMDNYNSCSHAKASKITHTRLALNSPSNIKSQIFIPSHPLTIAY